MSRNIYRDVLNISKIKSSIRKSQENYIHWKSYRDLSRKLALIFLDLYLGLME